jgi:hypothetical protein
MSIEDIKKATMDDDTLAALVDSTCKDMSESHKAIEKLTNLDFKPTVTPEQVDGMTKQLLAVVAASMPHLQHMEKVIKVPYHRTDVAIIKFILMHTSDEDKDLLLDDIHRVNQITKCIRLYDEIVEALRVVDDNTKELLAMSEDDFL